MKSNRIVIPSAMRIVSAEAIEALGNKIPRTLPHWGRSDLPRPGCICFPCNWAAMEAKEKRNVP
jgi:hypothetical protein